MIYGFRVNNFRSIREVAELDFRVPGTTPERPCFRRSLSRPDVRLPTVVVLVGPNGSGKTALLRAMAETLRFAASSYDHPIISEFVPFLAPETMTAPTRVEMDFDTQLPDSNDHASPVRYTVEFEREQHDSLCPTKVEYEALHSFPKGRPRRIFERRSERPIYVAKQMEVRPRDDRLNSIPPYSSAISALAKMGVGFFPTIAAHLEKFQTNVVGADPWRPDTEMITRWYRDNESLVDQVSNKLSRFDLGIVRMEPLRFPDGTWHLTFSHRGLNIPVVLPNESSGTRHLVHMFPQLQLVLGWGHCGIMDALDSEFHTELVTEVLDWFRRKETNPDDAQLICSLHNLSVLDGLEKEEVFIVQKDQGGATRVHGALDVAGLRRGGNLQKQYRSGVMGGMPTFG